MRLPVELLLNDNLCPLLERAFGFTPLTYNSPIILL